MMSWSSLSSQAEYKSLPCFFVEFEDHHLMYKQGTLGTWSSRVKEYTFEYEQEMRVLDKRNKLRFTRKGVRGEVGK